LGRAGGATSKEKTLLSSWDRPTLKEKERSSLDTVRRGKTKVRKPVFQRLTEKERTVFDEKRRGRVSRPTQGVLTANPQREENRNRNWKQKKKKGGGEIVSA